MVIVNVFAGELLRQLESTQFDLYIMDRDGYYIHHPDSRFSFNRYTGVRRTARDDFGDAAGRLNSIEAKAAGIDLFMLGDVVRNDDGAVMILRPKAILLEQIYDSNFKTALLIALLSIVLSGAVAFYVARVPIRLQQALFRSHQRLEKLTRAVDRYVAIVTTDTQGIITSVSAAFENISGYPAEELIGHKISMIRHPETPQEVHQAIWTAIVSGSEWVGEIRNRHRDGHAFWVREMIMPVEDEQGAIVAFMSIGIEVTEKKELEYFAAFDSLTGLWNRRRTDEEVAREVERAQRYGRPLAVIMVDIDHFKEVNDTFGHQRGDAVLATIGSILKNHTRASDSVGRFGGEEFLLICPETDAPTAMALAEKLRRLIGSCPFDAIGRKTASFGVAVLGDETAAPAELIARADQALYEAKRAGRNCVRMA